MLGNAIFKLLSKESSHQVQEMLRDPEWLVYFYQLEKIKLISNVDVLDIRRLEEILDKVQSDIIINCVGLIKQLDNLTTPPTVQPINAFHDDDERRKYPSDSTAKNSIELIFMRGDARNFPGICQRLMRKKLIKFLSGNI